MEKVVEMMTEMTVKAQDDKKAEEVEFAAYSQHCANNDARTEGEIEEAEAQREKLEGEKAKAEGDVKALAQEIKEFQQDITEFQARQDEVKATREAEHKEYKVKIQDLGESVDALERAVGIL